MDWEMDTETDSIASEITAPSMVADCIVNNIRSNMPSARSSLRSYISNFDPSLNNFDEWCAEVDRAKILNDWNDFECFSRIRNCLKGDAKTWLKE
jgi:hypothetical protein